MSASMNLNPSEFKLDHELRMAQCCLCRKSPWSSYSNAKAHAKTAKHKEEVAKLLKLDRMDVIGSSSFPIPSIELNSESHDRSANRMELDPGFSLPEEIDMSSLSNDVFERFYECVQALQSLNFPMDDSEFPLEDILNEWSNDLEMETFEEPYSNDVETHCPPPPQAFKTSCESEWAPYPSKAMFLTDVLFNSPRLRFSEAQKRAILKWGKDLGASDVPTLSALERVQETLNIDIGDPTSEKRTRSGNLFYINEIGAAIAKDISNPLVRPHLMFYPMKNQTGSVSQTWHAAKWCNELPDEMLTPMAIHPNGSHFYVGELSQLNDGTYFIPQRWFGKENNRLWASGVLAIETPNGFVVDTTSKKEYALGDFILNFEDLQKTRHIEFSESFKTFYENMPNPKRIAAGGRPYYHVFTILFIDDVSGNISKQWNKHHACYLSNACLPREQLDKEFNVRFIGSSPHINALELAQGIQDSFNKTKTGIIAYDSLEKTECMFVVLPYLNAADNPMHAEMCSQSGLSSNKFCRTCEIGGTRDEKRTDDGYRKLFQSGTLRDPETTLKIIQGQFFRAFQPRSQKAIQDEARKTGVKDIIAQPLIDEFITLSNDLATKQKLRPNEIREQLQKKYDGLKAEGNIWNPFLGSREFNVHMDCPTEILHTVLLGIVKYFWGQTAYLIIQAKKFDTFRARLESVSSDGLNIPNIMANYICQYRGSLIGKHFKTLLQIMPNVICDLVPADLLHVWLLMGRFGVLCWHTEIPDMDRYIEELEQVINQLLTKTAMCSPSIIITKPKFHFLTHLGSYIRRFGPALLFSTERYESYHTVFRLSSIHSNRRAPSRDTARTFAQLDRVKHITSGGHWYDKSAKRYVQAALKVRQMIASTPEYNKLLGFPKVDNRKPGHITLESLSHEGKNRTRQSYAWKSLSLSKTAQFTNQFPPDLLFHKGQSVLTQNKDVARRDSAIIFYSSSSEGFQLGSVCEIIVEKSDEESFIAVQIFEFASERHHQLDFPVIVLSQKYERVKAKDILCVVNKQHDCSSCQCTTLEMVPIYQERQRTTRQQKGVFHTDHTRFVLNTNSLHNYELLKKILPTMLPSPRTYYHENEHTAVRLQMVKQVRDKKTQLKEVREAREREVALGRASNDTTNHTGVEMVGGAHQNQEYVGPVFVPPRPPQRHDISPNTTLEQIPQTGVVDSLSMAIGPDYSQQLSTHFNQDIWQNKNTPMFDSSQVPMQMAQSYSAPMRYSAHPLYSNIPNHLAPLYDPSCSTSTLLFDPVTDLAQSTPVLPAFRLQDPFSSEVYGNGEIANDGPTSKTKGKKRKAVMSLQAQNDSFI